MKVTPIRAAGAFLVGLVVAMTLAAGSAQASAADVCPGMDSGKINVVDGVKEVTITAPDGSYIGSYCVKAGNRKQGGGPLIVVIDPVPGSPGPTTLTISYPAGKDLSHYSFSWTTIPTTTTTTVTPSTTTTSTTIPVTTTAPPVTTTAPPTTTTSVTPVCDDTSPTWNPATGLCELPFTGPGDWVLPVTAVGGFLLLLGALLLRVASNRPLLPRRRRR